MFELNWIEIANFCQHMEELEWQHTIQSKSSKKYSNTSRFPTETKNFFSALQVANIFQFYLI